MAVRDLLWGCPLCRAPGAIRPDGRRERCTACGATFRRGRGATIIASKDGSVDRRHASGWLEVLGPVRPPEAGPDGVILGPERVRVKLTRSQRPLHFGGELAGWVELYDRPSAGDLSLTTDELLFASPGGSLRWTPGDITGLQPASSSIQLGLHESMASVKFLDGSVRLWTRAISDLLRAHHRRSGREVTELQPFVRTRDIARVRDD